MRRVAYRQRVHAARWVVFTQQMEARNAARLVAPRAGQAIETSQKLGRRLEGGVRGQIDSLERLFLEHLSEWAIGESCHPVGRDAQCCVRQELFRQQYGASIDLRELCGLGQPLE
jgi:hypothetical protein